MGLLDDNEERSNIYQHRRRNWSMDLSQPQGAITAEPKTSFISLIRSLVRYC